MRRRGTPPDTGGEERTGGLTLRRAWCLAFGALTLLTLVWSLASPLGSPADENEHIVKAALVVRGHFTGTPEHPSTSPYLTVHPPRSYAAAINEPVCYVFDIRKPAGCQRSFPSSMGSTTTKIYTGRYPPPYYLVAGLPTLAFPAPFGFYAARFFSSLMVDALLAFAFAAAIVVARSRLLLVGLAVGLTPMVLYLAATVSPSALEISAAAAFWTALVLVVRSGAPPPRAVVAWMGVSGVALVVSRPPSPLWALCAIVAVVGGGLSPARLRTLLARSDVRIATVAVAVCAAAGLAWTGLEHATRVLPTTLPPPGASTGQIVQTSVGQATDYVDEAIGVFSLNVRVLLIVVLTWLAATGALLALAWTRSDRRGRIVLTLVVAAAAIVPTITVVLAARTHGYIGFGRYFLPLYVGIPIVAGGVTPPGRLVEDRRLTEGLPVLLALGQLLAFAWCLHRFAVGAGGPALPWHTVPGGWDPPLPATLLDLLFALALAGAAILVRRGSTVIGDPTAIGSPTGTGDPAGIGGPATREGEVIDG